MKVTWLCDSSSASNIPVKTLHYDHIITKEILTKDDNWLDFVNRNSVVCFLIREIVTDPQVGL